MRQRLVSVWQPFFLSSESLGAAIDAAIELEELGYSRLWFSGGFGENVTPRFREILDGTKRMGVASGIVSIWHSSPAEAAAFTEDAERDHPGRFLLGLGASHAVLVEGNGADYRKPYSKMVEYLDALDTTGLPPERRILAALGPRMLELSRSRSAGAHPYFTPVEHTAEARTALGPDRLLAPEVAVVLEEDAAVARATVAAGLEKHYQAGADEVAIQVLNGGDATAFPVAAFRALAAVLI